MNKNTLNVEFAKNLIVGNVEYFSVNANKGEDIVIQTVEKKDEKTIICFAKLYISPEIAKNIIESLQHALDYLEP